MRTLHLGEDLSGEILAAAREAFPLECCGLLEGVEAADGWRVLAVHRAPNLAEDSARHFLIDPQTQFDLLRRLRGSGRRIVGCFHSHPNGHASPSETDKAAAVETDFVWIVAAGKSHGEFSLNAFVFAADAFKPLTIKA